MKIINQIFVRSRYSLFALLLLFLSCIILGPGLIGIDGSGGVLPGNAFAQTNQSASYDQLKPFDHIILTWTGNPAYTQDVSWRTSVDVEQAFVEFAAATPGPYFVQNAVRMTAMKHNPIDEVFGKGFNRPGTNKCPYPRIVGV